MPSMRDFRTTLLPAIAVIGLGCNPEGPRGDQVAEAGELMFEMQSYTRGCPFAGALWSAKVHVDTRGVHTLSGTWLTETDPGGGACFEPRLPAFDCVFEVPLEVHTLDQSEVDSLERKLSDFPTLQAEVDGACDPCGEIVFSWGDRVVANVCTVEPDPEFIEAFGGLLKFLEQLALGSR